MSKVFLFLLMLLGAMLLLRTLGKSGAKKDSASPPSNHTPRGSQRMLACKLCGLHVPEDEAVRAGEWIYCCEDHRRRGG